MLPSGRQIYVIVKSTPSGSSVDPELPQLTATSDSLPAEPDVLFDDNSQESYKLDSLFEEVASSPVTQNSDQAMSQQSVPEEVNRHQEKAIRIAQEAVLKAQAAGNSDIPRVVSPSLLTSFDTEVKTTEPEEEGDKKPKRKRVRKPKAEKAPKPPKEPKENKPRPKRIRVRKKKGEKVEEEKKEEEEVVPKAEKPEKAEKVKTPKKPRLKPPSKKKKLPPATLLRKKKRKRGATSDVSDLDVTPPGSPRHSTADDDSVQKRRSARNTKRRKYNDDLDLNLSEDENQDVDVEGGGPAAMRMQQENAPEEESFTVEKILGCRIRQRGKDEEVEEEEEPEEEEYYVKYRNYSYLHCEWRTAAELMTKDKRIQMKLNRFKTRQLQQNLLFINKLAMEDYFNPDYVEVDRVLDRSVVVDPGTGEEVTHYLVKWRSLPYDECTWELSSDVDASKVDLFLKLREPPPPENRLQRARPLPSEWEQIKESRRYKNSNELREYQLEGVSWLTFCWYNKQNCILADEMGLGKTIQSITFLNEIFLYGIEGPYLVVAPLSTIANWQREFETWTDMNVITYHGSAASRNLLQEYEMYYKDEEGNRIPNLWKFHALITTYETIMIDIEVMNQIEFRCAIIDEAHRLKNKNCRLMEHLRVLDIEHVVLLTGTPLQNNTEELFSLLNYLNPGEFPTAEGFLKEYGDLKTEAQVESLKKILKPMMLRRLKEDVEKNLAPKEETIIEVELTNIQKKYYRAILERNVTFLARGGGSNNMPNLMNIMMELRKCCNHPYLIKGAEEKILEDMGAKGCPSQAFQALVQSCGKMVLLDKLLPKLEQNGHRVLVFSQMIKVLDLLEDYLAHRKYKYERLDGSKRGTARQEAIDRFSKPDSDRFVFLLCTRAGGLGINLTAADTVIIYDSDWNPQNDLQAQARCHRIGQNKPVKVYRLITRNSYEREMFDRASRKLGLDKAVLQSMGPEKQVNPNNMTKLEVEELLKKGAYGTLMDDDTAGDAFCEEDIDHILQRRTHVIQIESEGKGSTFAKASFSVSTNRTDIDINDPNFWQKWAKKNDVDLESQMSRNDLIIEEPRQRRQTARYGNEDCVMDMSELESSTDSENEEDKDKPRRGKKRGRRGNRVDRDFDGMDPEFSSAGYTRSDCFKVEKNLLIYGWGRWGDIISHGRFKRLMEAKDVHTIARAVLSYSLEYYQGDEKIKNFIWDLVRVTNENQLKNHSGLSAPVPRGRKGKKAKKDAKKFSLAAELQKGTLDIDPERILDEGYKRHLRRHSNKVLLRVRLLYYIKQEVIGDDAVKVLRGESYQDIDIPPPIAEGEPPAMWWDMDADKSLLIGIYKHGYEKYNMMRKDPALVFLHRCGPPDGAALLAEQNDDDDEKDDDDDLTTTKDFDEDDESMSSVPEGMKRTPKSYSYPEGGPENGTLPFPSISDMNTRVRRIIANYQRNHKKQQLRMQQEEKKMVKRERNEAMNREREIRRVESLQRWSRREEMDFYKLVARFGVEQKLEGGQKVYDWDQFKRLARLEHKSDQTMTDYFYAFYTMCMQVCGKMAHNFPMPTVYVAPITEERAARCLARIDLLSRIRESVLTHPMLEDRLQLCRKSSELPLWWEPGFHDRDLVMAAARHGVCHTVTHYLNDKTLSFHKQVEMVQSLNSPTSSTPKPERGLKLEADSASCSELTESPIKPLAAESLVKKEAEETKEEEAEAQEPAIKQESPDSVPSPAKVEAEEPTAAKVEKMEVEESEAASTSAAESQVEKKAEAEEPMEVEVPKTEVKEEAEEAAAEAKPKSPSPASPAEKVEEDAVTEGKTELVEVKKEEEEASSETGAVKREEQEEEEKAAPEEETSMSAKVECVDVKVEDRTEEEGGSVEGEEDVELKKELMRQTESPQPDFIKLREKPQPESGEESATPRQKSEYEILREAFPDLYRSQADMDDYEQSGYGGSEDQLARRLMGDPIGWPKDKVLFNRLEQIAHCVELGEWPLSRKAISGPSAFNSRSCTPVGSSTPKGEASLLDSDTGDAIMEINQGEGLKMTFHKRGRPPKRKYEIDAEQAAKMQVYLQQSGLHGSSRDTDSPHRASPLPTPPQPPQLTPQPLPLPGNSGLLNGSTLGGLDPHLLHHQLLMEQRLVPERKRGRGRRRKEDELSEMALHQAMQARSMSRILNHLDPEARVPLVNLEDGSMVKGDEAPRKKDLEAFLQEHSNFMVAQPPLMEEPELHPAMFSAFLQPELMQPAGQVVRRGRRRTRLDPRELEADKMTGEENVSVVNKETGKKITGAKAPPLKHLAQWLEQNPTFDVEAKWSHLVRGSGMFPKEMESRLLKPSNRGRKPNKPPREPPMTAPTFSPEMAASAMVNMPFAYGFNHLKMPFNHFMPSPLMMGGYGMHMGLNPLALGLEEEQKKAKRRKVDGGKDAEAGVSGLGAGLPHPSFPYLHPMMLTPQMMAHAARMQAGLPPTLSGPFGDLATVAATSSTSTATPSTSGINGQIDSGSEDEPKGGEEGKRDLQDLAEDLSMKRDKPRRKPSPVPPRERERVAHRPSSSSEAAEPMQTEATDLSMKPKPKPPTATSSPSHKTKKPTVSGTKQNINDIAAGLMMRKKSRSASVDEEMEGVTEQGEDSHQSSSKEPASDSESGADKSCAESIPVKEVEEEEEEKESQEEKAAEKEEAVVEEKVEEKEEEEEKVAEDSVTKEEAVAEQEKEAEEQPTTTASEAAAEGETTERTSPQPPADS